MCEYCGEEYSECGVHFYFNPATKCSCNAATDSEPVYTKIIKEIVTKELYDPKTVEKEIPSIPDDLRLKCMGRRGNDRFELIIKEMKLPINVEQFYERFRDALSKEAPNIKLMPGVKNVVKHFYRRKIPMGIATSCGQVEFTTTTQHLSDILDLIDHRVYGGSDEDIKFGKPNPEIFQTLAFRFAKHPSPKKCLVIESSIAGTEAAVEAGMQIVMIPDKAVPSEKYKKATIVLKSLETFDPDMFHLPSRNWAAELKELEAEEKKKEDKKKEERKKLIAERIAERERKLEKMKIRVIPQRKGKDRDDDDD